MKRYIISDPHFGHKNIIDYESRPFFDVVEMEETIIKNWNKTVKKNDMIYVLGDVSFYNKEITENILSRLNGRKFLIMGNHDQKWKEKVWRELGFECVYRNPIIIDNFFILSHEPMYMNNHMPYRNIHGHLHSIQSSSHLFFNASVELINYTPIEIGSIVSQFYYMNNRYEQEKSCVQKPL